MYATTFDYHRATTLRDAQRLLQQNPGAKLLAGGHSLVPLLKLRLAAPSAVVDIGRIAELRGIAQEGNAIRIGALTTHAELAASAELKKSAAALAEAAATVGDPAVRNRGTIGGNVAHADPASDLPTVLVALDASFIALGPNGERTIAADDFFTGIMATALNEHEILVGVRVPAVAAGQGSAYVKFSHPASRYAVIGAAARITLEGGKCTARTNCTRGTVAPRAARRIGRAGAHRHRRRYRHDRGGSGRCGRRSWPGRHRRHLRIGGVPGGGRARLHQARRCRRRGTCRAGVKSVEEVEQALGGQQYVADRGLALSIYLALRLKRPLFLEGEAGVGKTEVAKVLAAALQTELIRLQCYEGLDVNHAVYEWNYPRQILEIRMLEASHAMDRAAAARELFTESFLIKRPLLQALEPRERPPVLFIDEDRSRGRGVRGIPAGVALRLPGDDPRAGDDSRVASSGSNHHLKPHTRSSRRTEAALPVCLDRLSRLRQRTAHRRGQGPGRARRGLPSR